MKTFSASRLLLILSAAALSAVRSWAGCGGASCPIESGAPDGPRPGALRLDVSFQYINQDQPRVGQKKAAVGDVPNGEHDEVATINRLWNAKLDYDLSSRWGVGVMLPLISRTHDHIAAGTGDHERWSFTGVGDLTVQLRWAALAKEDPESRSLVLSAAGKFPTGAVNARNADETAEVAIQTGSGSYDFIGGALYSWNAAFAGVSYRRNNPGTRGYRVGDAIQANLGGSYPMGKTLDLLGQANFSVKRKDEKGDTGEDASFTGGNFLYLSPGARVRLTETASAYGYAQFPVYQRVNAEQLTASYNLLFGVACAFSAW